MNAGYYTRVSLDDELAGRLSRHERAIEKTMAVGGVRLRRALREAWEDIRRARRARQRAEAIRAKTELSGDLVAKLRGEGGIDVAD